MGKSRAFELLIIFLIAMAAIIFGRKIVIVIEDGVRTVRDAVYTREY